MQYNYLDFLSKVSNKVAPSGYEDDVVRIWKECIFPYVDDVMVDVMGNVIAVKKGTSGKKLMLAAHADEVGLIITHVDSSGFLYFDGIGGIDVDILLGRSVIIKGMSRDVYVISGEIVLVFKVGRDNSFSCAAFYLCHNDPPDLLFKFFELRKGG